MTLHVLTTAWSEIFKPHDQEHYLVITTGTFDTIGNVIYISVGRHRQEDILLSSYTTFGFMLKVPPDIAIYAKTNAGTAELCTFLGEAYRI